MAIQKAKKDKWKVDIRPAGSNGRRFIRLFNKKHQAIEFENWVLAEHSKLKPHEIDRVEDNRRLSELIELWHDAYGKTLNDSEKRIAKLRQTCDILGDPIAVRLTADDFADYRQFRLKNPQNQA